MFIVNIICYYDSKIKWFTWFSNDITVTLARAIEMKHAVTLIAALAYETAEMYQRGGEKLGESSLSSSFIIIDVLYLFCTFQKVKSVPHNNGFLE